jgi:hypothetical protein
MTGERKIEGSWRVNKFPQAPPRVEIPLNGVQDVPLVTGVNAHGTEALLAGFVKLEGGLNSEARLEGWSEVARLPRFRGKRRWRLRHSCLEVGIRAAALEDRETVGPMSVLQHHRADRQEWVRSRTLRGNARSG